MEINRRVGVVVMSSISVAGGTARVVIDLIKSLNQLGCEIHLFSPFPVDKKKIDSYYGSVQIKRVYNPEGFKKFLCKESILSRKLMKKEFIEMVNNVDNIIDIDGGVLHNYLPKKFDKDRYVVWRLCRVSSVSSEKDSWSPKNFKKQIKKFIRTLLFLNQNKKYNSLSKEYKIYAVDKWTRRELIKYWNLSPEKICLYPEIQVNRLLYDKRGKKDQIVIFGRIAPNKRINESIKIFWAGTKLFPKYKLIIMGGTTCDSNRYIKYLHQLISGFNGDKRIEFIKNPDFEKLKETLLDSKILIESEIDSITMTSLEAMAAGVVVLAHKESGTYLEILDKGKLGYGFDNIEEGSEKLELILKKIEDNTIELDEFIKRTEFFSPQKFIESLKIILKLI